MKIDLEQADLQPVIEAAVAEAIKQLEARHAKKAGRLAYPEAEAAALIGVASHVLRDVRLRGEIEYSRIGRGAFYTRNDLDDFLRKNSGK